ncbi:hypothetical protein, conserved [Babesia bigemina]|uniref:C3H1-type domain-containing protein n=1 Tax=Babesia bigemina TaxID=5866 RepID=A0A061BKD3_BABBI|nr:hypothetical protein, conserved [Babesia bigemina]CDR71383.1 hypothetical protein, conserved [Babesia bigemina]|eukprot:XP_012770333.1 hypothetical protein, conserved [Babesia bigemina]
MGFLSGVLSNIKDHLGQHNNTLNEAIKSLNTNKHAGKKGFNVAIAQVVKGVRGYNDGVRKSNLKVRKQIENFEREINTLKMKINDINGKIDTRFHSEAEKAEMSVRNASSECQQYAATFNETFNLNTKTEMKNDINDLNHPLSLKVIKAVGFVKDESERFKKLSDKESRDFDTMKSRIESVCTDHGKKVNAHICKEVTELVTKLRMLVRAILDELKTIEKSLFEYVQDLTKWIKQADAAVEAALEKVHIIITAVSEDSVFSNVKPIKDAAQELYDRAFELFDAGNKANKAADEHVKAALGKVKEMDGKLKEDLWKVKDAVSRQVGEIKNAIGKLYDQINTDKYSRVLETERKKFANLIDYIISQVSDIKGTAGIRSSGGLKGAVDKVNAYADGFKTIFEKNADDGTLYKWINASLVGGAIQRYLQHYGIDDRKTVITNIKQRVVEIAQTAGSTDKVPAAKKTVKETLDSIKEYLTAFASKVKEKLQDQHEIKKFIDTIKSNTKIYYDDTDHLTSAVRLILILTSTAASNLTDDLDKFILGKSPNIATMLQSAYEKANDFCGKLNIATGKQTDGKPGTDLPNLAKAVDSAIEQVKATVDGRLKGDTAESLTLDSKTTFNQYNSFVDQTESKLNALTSADFNTIREAGTLPQAIGAIQRGVEEALSQIGVINGKVQTQFNTLTSNFQNLCEAVMNAARDDKDSAKTNLEKLKNTYFKHYDIKKKDAEDSIKKIKHDLETLRAGPVTRALTFGEQFLKPEADKLRDETTEKLKQQIDDEVAKAKKELTTRARIDYVSTMKMLLLQYEDRVAKELTGIPQEISDDLITGFKGFMGTFAGENGRTVSDVNIEKLKSVATTISSTKYDPKHFTDLAKQFQSFWQPLNTYLKKETKRVHAANNEKTNPKPSGDETLYTSKIDSVSNELNRLLNHLCEHNRYDYRVPSMLDILVREVHGLHPESFSEPNTPLLETIAHGFRGLVGELGKAYISVYDSETFGGEMFEKQKLTAYGTKFAKICLTVVCTLKATLTDLTHNCKSLRGQQINKSTDVGKSFVGHGYAVSDAALQNGELQNRPTVAGENVAKRLLLPISGADGNQHLKWCKSNERRKADHFHVFDAVDCIFSHFEQYNELCHLLTASAKQHPCSVYDILIWLSGFPYTAVYATMRDITISDLFDNPHKKAAGDDELELTSTDMAAQSITAHPRNISYNYVRKAVDHICATSYDVLTAVVGTGDSRTVYASDFCNNSFNFHYPSDPSDCLDMLLDLLRRLLPVFRFLELQCNITPEHHGWSHCRYGRDIPTTKSQCNEHSSEEASGQAKCQVNCQPTSPLMLYLSDSLPGHLPHQLQSVGCRAKCSTCSKSAPGQPCLLPLGFKGFSGSTKTGRQLRDAIKTFLGTGLISSLMCLLPKPPSTLPEHFQFVFTLVGAFNASRDGNSNAVNAAFVKAIRKQSIDLYAEPSQLTGALSDAYKNGQSHEGRNHPRPTEADLSSLSKTESCKYASTDDVHCAPYLSTLYSDAYHYAAEKHAGLYLSWAVYLPWSFWQCLESLFRAFTNISCQDWGCRRCTHGTACKRGKHGAAYNCQCKGLVECRGVISTLYSFGFTFGNPATLSAAEGKRYCHNFYKQLHNVLNSSYFRKLFEKCDEFIFTIREPFIWLNVALWSLSLFYLICVMVGRLDVLHIRSHLRTPSSHRITAQSLLAAAQVGSLAKISYLQP